MLLTPSLVALLGTATAGSIIQHPIHESQAESHASDLRIPSIHESTVMARRILHLSATGTLITTFPDPAQSLSTHDDDASTWENRPAEMASNPIGLMEYYADCEPKTGNPTLLAINIATPYKNYAAGSNISLHVRWWPTQTHTYTSSFLSLLSSDDDDDDEDIPTPHTPAALPRFSLHGHLESISTREALKKGIAKCFLKSHPDSILWQPGNDIHTSEYMRFVVEHVYWFGGFGDRARIGWLPIEEWKNVTVEEVEELRLPGEKSGKKRAGWRDWL